MTSTSTMFPPSRSLRSMCHCWTTLLVAAAAAGVATPALAEIPEALEQIVFGDEKRPVIQATINGAKFEGLTSFSDFPYLLWPVENRLAGAFPHDRAQGAAWLNRAAVALGYEGFEARFKEVSSWRTNEVWLYDLVRDGLTLHDARLEIHWDGETFLGLVNHTPGTIRIIEEGEKRDEALEWVWYAMRDAEGGAHRVVPARVDRTDLDDRTLVSIVGPEGEVARAMQPSGRGLEHQNAKLFTFQEYRIPVGVFPDQISVGEDGLIWLSQPNSNFITSFNPATAAFTQYPCTGANGPDGLIVGTQGRVWSGMYFAGGLGVLDSNTGVFNHYNAPYANAAMAIPVETSDGNVWVTDHALNRISEFDPPTGTWIRSLVMPTGNCWVVQGYEDRDHGFVYFTEYNANKLGRVALGGNTVTDINTLGGGPAFCVYSNGKVYYSRWNESGIGVYDVTTQQMTEYDFPIANEPGGPMWLTPDGKIATGTRNRGYIMMFNPGTARFTAYQIPTQSPGLKDGLTVGPDGVIWFTESGVDKLGKLTILPFLGKPR